MPVRDTYGTGEINREYGIFEYLSCKAKGRANTFTLSKGEKLPPCFKEQKLDITESKGLLSMITDKIKKSVATRAIAYGLAGALTFGLSYDIGYSMEKKASKIAFTSARDGNREIYVMNADGSNPINLTNNPDNDNFPAWSSDGSKIAFASNRDGYHDIYVMNADGSNQTRLTKNYAEDASPAWSPDGSKIAFASMEGDLIASREIYVMNADGSNQARLTKNSASDSAPAWSPDGSKIAFTSFRGVIGNKRKRVGNMEIYVMNADGSNQIRLTKNPAASPYAPYALAICESPAWSPDGSKIAFASNRYNRFGNVKIYVMNADGSKQTRLTNNSAYDASPAWSPDGSKIAFVSGRDGNQEIYVMNADGSNQTRLTNNLVEDGSPAWSPK